MPPIQKDKVIIKETLHAHADAIDREPAQQGDIFRRHVVGIGLQRYLFTLGEIVMLRNGAEKSRKLRIGELRRRSSSEIKSFQRFALQIILPERHLTDERLKIRRFITLIRIGVKVAIDAALFAKRHVDVQSGHQCCASSILLAIPNSRPRSSARPRMRPRQEYPGLVFLPMSSII